MTPWESSEFDAHEQVCCFTDAQQGLKVLVAIHSTVRGPAVGGTRFRAYTSFDAAADDVLRLSRAMSYKCALAGAPYGGGKAVIFGDPATKTRDLLHSYGRFLNRVGPFFSTGEDVGVSVADCEVIREVSPYVAGTDSLGAGDPGIHTAKGVLHGLRAVVQWRLDRDQLTGVHFAVQGLGSVGWRLCEYLYDAGARLTVADLRADRCEDARERFRAQVVDPLFIHAVDADIYVPCAFGGVINSETVGSICAKAVAGAANNQLESAQMGEELHRRGILFAPDYVINAGGVIGVLDELALIPGRKPADKQPVEVGLSRINSRLLEIFSRAAAEQLTPESVAVRMARELISR
jgi:leucine dehydrogenase